MLALDARVADVHGFTVNHLGPALNDLDLVLLQQRRNAGGQAINDTVLPLDALADVEGRRRNADAQRRMLAVVLRLVKLLGDMNQRLGGNAADVQASAAQRLAFHQNGRDAQLTGTDRRHITARAAADDQQRGIQGLHDLLHKQGSGLFEQATNGLDE
ncbi:hypothetical protein D3C84_728670 [compost metagenome]